MVIQKLYIISELIGMANDSVMTVQEEPEGTNVQLYYGIPLDIDFGTLTGQEDVWVRVVGLIDLDQTSKIITYFT